MSLLEPDMHMQLGLSFYDSQRQSWIEQDEKVPIQVKIMSIKDLFGKKRQYLPQTTNQELFEDVKSL